jgi:hypothetical protein
LGVAVINKLASRAGVVSSDTILRGTMIEETYAAMRCWNFDIGKQENLSRIQSLNSIGARSSSWLEKVCKVFNRRFDPNNRDRALAELAQGGLAYDVWKPLMLWHMTRDEFLVKGGCQTSLMCRAGKVGCMWHL